MNPALMMRVCWGGGGGGGGTASLKVGTHCQTTAPAFGHCPPLSLFLPHPILEGHIPPPPNINTKISTKVFQSLLNSFLYIKNAMYSIK